MLVRNPKVHGATFTRNTFKGGWPLFESLAGVLALCDKVVVYDCGSDDGTLEKLRTIAESNPRVEVRHSDAFNKPQVDAGDFAVVANECVDRADVDHVWFWQADEVMHEGLLQTLSDRWQSDLSDRDKYDLSFWRLQVSYNFQRITWLPHIVHRVIWRGWQDESGKVTRFNADGRSTDREWAARLVYRDKENNGSRFTQWGEEFGDKPEEQPKMPFHEFLFDCTKNFLGNIRERRKMHAPFWHESSDVVDGNRESMNTFMSREEANPEWQKKESPFAIPKILEGLVGHPTYYLRAGLLEALAEDAVEERLL